MSGIFNPAFLIAILTALTVHEWAHAFIANRLGDPTAEREGRLTLNPIAHLDPLGTLMFFLVSFGWGKPVPVNPRYFQHPKRDSALVALAGPLSNLILACITMLVIRLLSAGDITSADDVMFLSGFGTGTQEFVTQLLGNLLLINLGLMAFNLLPIAPLDGSKIIQLFIPYTYEEEYQQYLHYGPYILLGLIVLERVTSISILGPWIYGIMNGVLSVLTLF